MVLAIATGAAPSAESESRDLKILAIYSGYKGGPCPVINQQLLIAGVDEKKTHDVFIKFLKRLAEVCIENGLESIEELVESGFMEGRETQVIEPVLKEAGCNYREQLVCKGIWWSFILYPYSDRMNAKQRGL